MILAYHRDIHNYIGDPDVPAEKSDLKMDVSDNGTTYRWTIAPTYNYILSIVFFVPNFQDFSAYCSDLNMLASEWGADYLSGGNLLFLRVDYDITQVMLNHKNIPWISPRDVSFDS